MPKLIEKSATSKPPKPYADYPLFPHATRRWAKKIRGKTHYFGPWDDPDRALQQFIDQRDDLYAGRKPRSESDGLDVRELLNRFLTSKQRQLEIGEITNRTFLDYKTTCERIRDTFGVSRLVDDLAGDDFEKLRAKIAKTRGPVSLGNEVQRVRVVFNFAYNNDLIERPVRYGSRPAPDCELWRAGGSGHIRIAPDSPGTWPQGDVIGL